MEKRIKFTAEECWDGAGSLSDYHSYILRTSKKGVETHSYPALSSASKWDQLMCASVRHVPAMWRVEGSCVVWGVLLFF